MKIMAVLVLLVNSSIALSDPMQVIRGFECQSKDSSSITSNHFVIQILEDWAANVYALDGSKKKPSETLYRPVWEQTRSRNYSYVYEEGSQALVRRNGDRATEILIPKIQIEELRFDTFRIQVKFEGYAGNKWSRSYQCENRNRKGR